MTINFQNETLTLIKEEYANGNTALSLVGEIGIPHMRATVNINEKLPEDIVIIKNYSENAGILDALKDAGVITHIIKDTPSGYTTLQICEIDLDLIA